MPFEPSSEATVTFVAEAVLIDSSQVVVRIQVVQNDSAKNDGYCYDSLSQGDRLSDIASFVAGNPHNTELAVVWKDNPDTYEEYAILENDYNTACEAHENGPEEGWETVHTYMEGPRKVEVQVAETHGAWFYRSLGASEDGVYDEVFRNKKEVTLAAKRVAG